ncbi:hypothetical protein [Streptomyces xinghaiensis]|uniref:hypothetical protein n=1 Tax=Streptomyces xinghaiensis TaxID=1038928 RepID=UPI0012FFADF9|nr:hypothetical protein [Streptomyces xinghaiensis]MZE78196.1 hypothetical protein [Streptomyces sp. SID5475]
MRLTYAEMVDEGTVALLSGACALIGSLIGAVGAWQGAKLGALKAVEAVKVQADAEHAQWAREHRKAAWMTALDATMEIVGALGEMEVQLAQGRTPQSGIADLFVRLQPLLATTAVQLSVWGPDEGADACTALVGSVGAQFRAATDWIEAIGEGRDSSVPQAAYLAADEQRRRDYTTFIALASSALRDSP